MIHIKFQCILEVILINLIRDQKDRLNLTLTIAERGICYSKKRCQKSNRGLDHNHLKRNHKEDKLCNSTM
jgi:hypothetical protein